jgi:enoyl-CoA hydratase/carnithine racemase
LVPDSGGTYVLPRLVGTARAMGLAMLGDKLTADQAAAWGLIWQCVDDVELPAVTEKLLASLAQAPTRGLAAIKQAIHAASAIRRRAARSERTCERWATVTITARAWPRSSPSVRRGSPGVGRTAMAAALPQVRPSP